MQNDDPIRVDDPAILALVERLAMQLGCSGEEAIGIAVSRAFAESILPECGSVGEGSVKLQSQAS